MSDALFTRAGLHTYAPTELTTGPWRPDAMHGGPPSALLATVAHESLPSGFHLSRLNVELERPVPLVALTTAVNVRTVSRRVVHIDVSVTVDDGRLVLSGRALAVAQFDVPEPASPRALPTPVEVEPDGVRVRLPEFVSGAGTTYHRDAVEHRMPSANDFVDPGPSSSWVRLLYAVVAGEPVVPFARVMAAADFGSGISALYRSDEGVGLINADLSVAVSRTPVGEWIHIDSRTHLHGAGSDDQPGSALAVTRLGDTSGSLGVATQSLLALSF